ncbi:MAG: hypothetical protein KDA60_04850 [Planctomycetales bacterium]|nr:hypothetical protein [Planctomycetales bacterium]
MGLKPLSLVIVQLSPVWEDKPASHARVRKLLAGASIEPGSLIVLPEMFDTGFSMRVAATAQGETQESESFVRELATQYDAAVLAGVVSRQAGNLAANEAVALAPDGGELVRYRKMQPFSISEEEKHYVPGHRHQLFTWGGLTIAPFICYDLRFPEVFRPAVRAGAELIIVIASWPDVRSEHWVRLLQARAIGNLAFVVGVNRCGTDPTLTFDGRSCAFDPHGQPLFEADAREQVATVKLDATVVRQWREQFPALRDMRSTP